MISDLKPYPAYKDSGVPWLGEVPEHWGTRRLRDTAEMRISNVDKHTKVGEQPVRLCNYVDVYKNDRIRSAMAFMRATATTDEVRRFRLMPGDVLITKDSEAWNDIGVPALVEDSKGDIVCGYHLALLRPFPERVIAGYLFRALQSTAIAYQFHIEANGVTRYGLSHGAIKSVWLPLPPLPEQTAIVRFLSHADQRIRRYIRAKRKLITLLNEQKQAIIHRAVTRGLDLNVRFRPSGVEWLGDVPEHWEVVPLKRIASFKSGSGFPVSEQGGQNSEIPFLRVSDMTRPGNEAWIESADSTVSVEVAERLGAYIFPAGAIIFPKVGGALLTNKRRLIRKASCIDNNIMGCVVNGAALQFIFVLLQQLDLGRLSKPGPVPAIGEGDVREIKVALPPTAEQVELVNFIREATAPLIRAIALAEREISLLREYRIRLIADVVTGKLDVREAAANLPDEAEEPEAPEETEALTEREEAPEDAELDAVPEEAEA